MPGRQTDKRKNMHMRRLLLLGTIAAIAMTTTSQAQSAEQRRVVSRASAKHHVNTQRTVIAPSTNRTVVRRYTNGGYYYGGGGPYYSGYYPYYYSGPSVSVGFNGVYPYSGYNGYGYGYPYNYGYGYPSDYYDEYPRGYTTTTTYTTSRYGDLAYNDNIVVAVQERLTHAGYYRGAIDAVAGPKTRSAVARWQGNHGMIADGRIDERTLRALGIS